MHKVLMQGVWNILLTSVAAALISDATVLAATRMHASTCHEIGCKRTQQDYTSGDAARSDATTATNDWMHVLRMAVCKEITCYVMRATRCHETGCKES